MKPLRAAVVGVGYLGNFHAQKYKSLCATEFKDQIEFVGVCDALEPQAKKVAQENGVQSYASAKDLIGKVDLVTIATVTSAHYEMAKMFLSAGVHVNVEKPIASTVDQAQELVSLAKKQSKVLCVGHSERFNPGWLFLQNKIKNPKMIEFYRHAPFKGRGGDVSVVHDLMIHDLDLALSLEKGTPSYLNSSGGSLITANLDYVVAQLKLGKTSLFFSTSRLSQVLIRKVKVLDETCVWESDLQTGEVICIAKDGSVETHQAGKADHLLLETSAFFKASLGLEKPFITGEHGLAALVLAENIVQGLSK